MPRVRSDRTRSVFPTILRIYPIGKLHGVTICRELMHSDQINKFVHAGTDRLQLCVPKIKFSPDAHVRRLLRFAYLAPDIVEAIVEGGNLAS